MRSITLTPEEEEHLREILDADLTKLRLENADTDRREYKAMLRRKEDFLEELLRRPERTAA